MKRLTALLLSAVTALSLTACGKSNDTESDNGSAESTESISGESPQKTALFTPKTENGELKTLDKAYGTRDGFYFISDNYYLKYFDYASRQEIYVCPDSSCKHDSEHCTAYFGNIRGEEMGGRLFGYGEYLYYLSYTLYHEGGVSHGQEEKPVIADETALYRMNSDGTNREKIFTFDKGETVDYDENFVIADGECVWVLTKTPSLIYNEETGTNYSGAKNTGLVKLDLEKREIIERIPIDLYNNVRLELMGAYKNRFVFRGKAQSDGKTMQDSWLSGGNAWPEYNYAFFTLNRDDKVIKEIFRSEEPFGWPLFFHIIDDTLYVTSSDNHETITAVNLDTGKAEVISDGTGYWVAGAYGPEIGGMLRMGKDDSKCTCLYDPKKRKLINTDKMLYNFFIFWENGEVAYGELYDWDANTKSMVIISVEDYINNNPNYEVLSTGKIDE